MAKIAVSCPIDTYSGYGARARDLVKALLTKPSDRFHGCLTMLHIGDEDFNDYTESR